MRSLRDDRQLNEVVSHAVPLVCYESDAKWVVAKGRYGACLLRAKEIDVESVRAKDENISRRKGGSNQANAVSVEPIPYATALSMIPPRRHNKPPPRQGAKLPADQDGDHSYGSMVPAFPDPDSGTQCSPQPLLIPALDLSDKVQDQRESDRTSSLLSAPERGPPKSEGCSGKPRKRLEYERVSIACSMSLSL